MKHWVVRVLAALVVVSILCAMIFVYITNMINHDIVWTADRVPCSDERVNIGHDGPFTALTFMLYAREHKCNWYNFMSTGWSEKRLHGAGGDAMPAGSVYYNFTLPSNMSVYYTPRGVNLTDGSDLGWVPIRGNVSVEYRGNGIQLWKVVS
jgi:hypothetical protein